MAYPRSQRSRSFKLHRASSGTVAVTTSWALIDAAYTITLSAQVGDVIEMLFEGFMAPSVAASLYMDYEIGGIRQGDATNGSWAATYNAGWWGPANPHWFHTVASGDVGANPTVTVKPWGKGQSAQSFTTTPRPLWCVKNLGPPSR